MLKKQKPPSGLDVAIGDVLSDMKGFTSDADEYTVMVDQLVKLHALKECEKPRRVSKDTLAVVAGNLAGIVLILSYERAHVVTTKAAMFMLKAKSTF